MSRTKRGSKPAGFDYWSRRPHGKTCIGRFAKKVTLKSERQQSKDITRKELENDDCDS